MGNRDKRGSVPDDEMREMSEGDESMRGVAGSETRWDSKLYDETYGIVTQLGAGVFELLAPRPGERIIDLGCRGGGDRRLGGDDRSRP